MPTLELSTAEASLLADVLAEMISDLGMEIAATDSQDFRDRLKDRRDLLQKITDSLRESGATG